MGPKIGVIFKELSVTYLCAQQLFNDLLIYLFI